MRDYRLRPQRRDRRHPFARANRPESRARDQIGSGIWSSAGFHRSVASTSTVSRKLPFYEKDDPENYDILNRLGQNSGHLRNLRRVYLPNLTCLVSLGGHSTMEGDSEADAIAEELLHLTGTALLYHDFRAFSAHFKLPLRLETVEGHRFITTEDEFRDVFHAVVDHMADTDVEDFVRTVIFAQFVDDDTIRSVHLCSEIHTGGELRRPAYPVHSTIVRDDTRWKIAACFYIILDSASHNTALVDISRPLVPEMRKT